jgi:hypothetical protein
MHVSFYESGKAFCDGRTRRSRLIVVNVGWIIPAVASKIPSLIGWSPKYCASADIALSYFIANQMFRHRSSSGASAAVAIVPPSSLSRRAPPVDILPTLLIEIHQIAAATEYSAVRPRGEENTILHTTAGVGAIMTDGVKGDALTFGY